MEDVICQEKALCINQDRRWDSQLLFIIEVKPSDAVKGRACSDVCVHGGCITNEEAGF